MRRTTPEPLTAIALIIDDSLGARDSEAGRLAALVRECVPSDLHGRGGFWSRHTARGLLIDAVAARAHTLQRSGLASVDPDNPLHVIAALHPDRGVRLASLKLARKLDINITDVCNFKCEYCYQRSRDDMWESRANERAATAMSPDALVATVDQAVRAGARSLKFTGGEPLASPTFLPAFSAVYQNPALDEVELVSNLSLMKGRRLEVFRNIVGRGRRVHVHLSIDGFHTRSGAGNDRKIFDDARAGELERLALDVFPEATFSVNTMWTRAIMAAESYTGVLRLLHRIRPRIWSISLPYLVKDVVDHLGTDPEFVPRFDEVISVSGAILELNAATPEPLSISIPLAHHEDAAGWLLTTSEADDLIDHPCMPCNGSYFVVGPFGNVFDCLLLSRSAADIEEVGLVGALVDQAKGNPYYDMHIDSVSEDCVGCRYQDICRGQCPNDRFNAGGARFGRDKAACSLLARAERELWSREDAESWFAQAVRASGFTPATYDSLAAIVRGEPPTMGDVTEHGTFMPPADSPVRVTFHTS